MNLKEYDPKDVIKNEYYEEYEKEIRALGNQLLILDSNIFILKKIFEFPLGLFFSNQFYFWKIVIRNLLENNVSIIWRIHVDADKDVITLNKLKNSVLSYMANDVYKKQIKMDLKAIGPVYDDMKKYEAAITQIRHNTLGHFKKDIDANSLSKQSIRLDDVVKISRGLIAYFDVLCFGFHRTTRFYQYEDGANGERKSDIENIIETLIKSTWLFSGPENEPDIWKYTFETLKDGEIIAYNKIRKKFGYTEISR